MRNQELLIAKFSVQDVLFEQSKVAVSLRERVNEIKHHFHDHEG
jgi:hypothetical protein